MSLKTMALFAGSLLLPSAWRPQDRETDSISLPTAGSFRSLVRQLSETSRYPIEVDPGIEEKEVKLEARGVSFFEALDTLCRAHGNATYLGTSKRLSPPRSLTLRPGAWTQFPSAYSGRFKVILEGWIHMKDTSPAESEESTHVYLSVLPDPGHRLLEREGATKWTLTVATDGLGNDLLGRSEPGAKEESPQLGFLELRESGHEVNASRHRARLRPMKDPGALRRLKGEIQATAAEIEDVRVPLDVGKEVPFSGGSLRVTAVQAVKVYSWMETRVTLAVKTQGDAVSPDDLFECYGTYDGDKEGWDYLRPSHRGQNAEIQVKSAAPKWVLLRLRKNFRTVHIPFEFANVSFEERR
jgi:hypothetical protein